MLFVCFDLLVLYYNKFVIFVAFLAFIHIYLSSR